METSSTWYVFMGRGYTTMRGMNSFHGQFNTFQDARDFILRKKDTGWYQIVKASTMVVWEYGFVDERNGTYVLSPIDNDFPNPVNNRGILDD
jgi:hypothetical protein